MTSPDASILFPQFMYEAILKVATDDPDFEFKVKSTAYPVVDETRVEFQHKESSIIVFIIAIAYALILSIIVGHIVEERTSRLKYFQVT